MRERLRAGRKEVAVKWQTCRTVLLSAIGGAIVWWVVLGAVFGCGFCLF